MGRPARPGRGVCSTRSRGEASSREHHGTLFRRGQAHGRGPGQPRSLLISGPSPDPTHARRSNLMSHPTAIRPNPGEYLDYYGKYIALVPDDQALPALERQGEAMFPFLRSLNEAQGALRYAPGKWSIKQVIG